MQQRLDDTLRHLVNQTKSMLESARRDFKEAVIQLEALNPLSILKRGYSVTYDSLGNLVLHAGQLRAGDVIKTRLENSSVDSKVIKTEDALNEK